MLAYFYLMRLHRPIPILIVLYPTLWALFAASSGVPSVNLLIIFTLGAFLMRAAGCVFNDIADRDFDKHVKRTLERPLARGEINTKHAFLFGCILLFMAFSVVLLLNILTVLLSFIALVLALLYPFSKRFFVMPQLVLGLAFNFGIIMAYTAVQNKIPISAWVLYSATIFWSVSYDTIYALPDKPYDLQIGLKSSTITFGKYVFHFIIICQTIMLVLLIIFGVVNHYNIIYYSALLICIILFFQQSLIWKKGGLENCIKAFSGNHWQGFTILIAVMFQ